MGNVLRLLGRKPQEVIEPIVYTEDDGFEEGDRGFFNAVEKAEGADGRTRPIVPRVLESRPIPGCRPQPPSRSRSASGHAAHASPAASAAAQRQHADAVATIVRPRARCQQRHPADRTARRTAAALARMSMKPGCSKWPTVSAKSSSSSASRAASPKSVPVPVVTLFELEPAAGVRSSKVIALAEDIARAMSATSARVAVIPGRNAIGIELPNPTRETVYLRDLLNAQRILRARAWPFPSHSASRSKASR
jgi:hypothetical protein